MILITIFKMSRFSKEFVGQLLSVSIKHLKMKGNIQLVLYNEEFFWDKLAHRLYCLQGTLLGAENLK